MSSRQSRSADYGVPHIGGDTLAESLSIIVPVHNAEMRLRGNILRLLDMLPDLTSQFEILIVDDASTDQTVEVAYDLARQFPQVRTVLGQDTATAIERGLTETRADVVFVQESSSSDVSSRDLQRLWALRHDDRLVIARAESELPNANLSQRLIQKLMDWGEALKETTKPSNSGSGIQMIRREAAENCTNSVEESLTMRCVARKNESHRHGVSSHPQQVRVGS